MYWIYLLFFSILPVSTKNFDIFDVQDLQRALEGPVNTTQIIKTLCNRDRLEIEKIKYFYQKILDEDLTELFDEKLRYDDDFKFFIKAIIDKKEDFEAKELHEAMKGYGTDEDVLIEILVARTNEELNAIKNAFTNLYGKDFVEELKGDTEGDLEEFVLPLVGATRDESNHVDVERAKQDAKRLYYAGVGKTFGTNEEVFNEIFLQQNFDQLRLVFDEYEVFAKDTIENAIDDETSGYIYQALLELIRVIRNKSNYFARLIEKSGDIRRMIRTIVLRSEIDLAEIVKEFGGRMKLKAFIEERTAGDLRNALVTFLENQWDE